MPSLLPEQWKEPLERVYSKFSRFMDRLKPVRHQQGAMEQITADQLPLFIQRGGPPFDMNESNGELIITAEIPGMTKEEVKVELSGKKLTIRGEKKAATEQKGRGGRYISECRYGSFVRTVQLPYSIDADKVKAELKNGVLSIRTAVPEEKLNRISHRVPVS